MKYYCDKCNNRIYRCTCHTRGWLVPTLVALSISGCASPFDSILLHDIIDLQEISVAASGYCESSATTMVLITDDLEQRANKIEKYTRYASPDLHPIAVDVLKLYTEFYNAYRSPDIVPSAAYCKTKLGIGYKMVDKFIEAAGKKPR